MMGSRRLSSVAFVATSCSTISFLHLQDTDVGLVNPAKLRKTVHAARGADEYLYVSCSNILWVVLVVLRDATWIHQHAQQVEIHPQCHQRGEQK
jgi:hypothetical protein